MYKPTLMATKTQPIRNSANINSVGSNPPKTLHYNSNGSGRDSYITVTSGGLFSQTTNLNAHDTYMADLRNYRILK